MLRKFYEGNLNAHGVTLGAQAHVDDVGRDACSSVHKLARAGRCRVRVRRGVSKPDSRHFSRNVLSVSKKTSILPGPCMIQVPMFDEDSRGTCERTLAMLLPYETLENVIETGQEDRWASMSVDQRGFHDELEDWKTRLEVGDVMASWLAIAVWGDSAPYAKRDSVFLFYSKY